MMIEETIKSSISERLIIAEANKIAIEQSSLTSKRDDELNAKLDALMNKTNRRRATTHHITFFSASTEESETTNREITSAARQGC